MSHLKSFDIAHLPLKLRQCCARLCFANFPEKMALQMSHFTSSDVVVFELERKAVAVLVVVGVPVVVVVVVVGVVVVVVVVVVAVEEGEAFDDAVGVV